MAGKSSVMVDGSRLSRVDQNFYKIESFLALLSGLAVFSLMVLAVISVGGRQMFNQPLPGYVDWIEQLMPLIAFMGVAYTQRDGGHIRMDILVGALKGRALWIAEIITLLGMLLVMVLLVWGSWEHFQRSFDFNAPWWSRDSSMDINIPIWPAKLLAPIAFGVLVIRICLQLYAYGRLLGAGQKDPIAVPLVEDAATQAAKEADSVSGAERE